MVAPRHWLFNPFVLVRSGKQLTGHTHHYPSLFCPRNTKSQRCHRFAGDVNIVAMNSDCCLTLASVGKGKRRHGLSDAWRPAARNSQSDSESEVQICFGTTIWWGSCWNRNLSKAYCTKLALHSICLSVSHLSCSIKGPGASQESSTNYAARVLAACAKLCPLKPLPWERDGKSEKMGWC